MTAAELATTTRARAVGLGFYFWAAAGMMMVALAGFAPIFWIPLAQGLPERFPLYAVHGMLCYGWIALVMYQAWLVRAGRVARHRDIGLAGVSLATALVIFGLVTTAHAVHRTMAAGHGEGAKPFMIVTAGELTGFTVFLVAGLFNMRRAEWHKRFLIAGTNWLLPAPVARLGITGPHVPTLKETVGLAGLPPAPLQPVDALSGVFIVEFFVLAGIIHDWKKHGRIHPAWCWATAFNLGFAVLAGPFSRTSLWLWIARGWLALF
jgi:hypothetical protein